MRLHASASAASVNKAWLMVSQCNSGDDYFAKDLMVVVLWKVFFFSWFNEGKVKCLSIASTEMVEVPAESLVSWILIMIIIWGIPFWRVQNQTKIDVYKLYVCNLNTFHFSYFILLLNLEKSSPAKYAFWRVQDVPY